MRFGMKFKVVASITAVITVFTLILGVLGVTFANNIVEKRLLNTYSSYNGTMSRMIMEKMNRYVGGVRTVSANTNLKEIINHPDFSPYTVDAMKAFQESDPYIKLVYMGDETGRTLFYPEIGVEIDSRERPWYVAAKAKEDIHFTEAYLDTFTNERIITVAKGVYNGDEFIGVTGVDINFSFLMEYIKTTKFADTGLSYLVNLADATCLVHGDENRLDDKIPDSIMDIIKEKKSDMEIVRNEEGEKVFVVYNYIEAINATLITEIDYAEIAAISNSVKMTVLIFGIVSAATLILLGIVLANAIVNPVKRLTEAADRISQGDFDVELEVNSNSELGLLAKSFSLTIDKLKNYQAYINEISDGLLSISEGDLNYEMKLEYSGQFAKLKNHMETVQENLSRTLQEIWNASKEVDAGAVQVSNVSQSLSHSSQEQSNTIEKLSSSINQVTVKINDTSHNAELAKEKANNANVELERCSVQMNEMMEAMEHISKKSDEISKIIKMIDDIAFQTNILALNAAVEAARAGQAGKGFSVVADEVRNLAVKSAESVQNTTALIEETLSAVKNGVDMAKRTSVYLENTAKMTEETKLLIDEIANASDEQTHEIEQVNLGVGSTAEMVQTNAATSEESAATSEELSTQANLLRNLLSKFQFRE